jgi:hypothetical protein
MSAIIGLLFMLIYFAVIFAVVAGVWKAFVKAGLPGWACLVPIYNAYLIWQMTNKPIVYFILLFVPFASILPMIEVAKAYGKGTGMGIALAFGIGWPIIGFGNAVYQGKKVDMNVNVPAANS